MKVIQAITLLSILSFSSVATAATENIETARAMDYFKRIASACQKNDQNLFWSQFSSRKGFRGALQEKRNELFTSYCSGVTSQTLKQLESYDFYIKARDGNYGSAKTVLCRSPKGLGPNKCEGMFDVAIENGQIKRDEN
jgi:predicted small secreted protein